MGLIDELKLALNQSTDTVLHVILICMTYHTDAIYEAGVFRPLTSLGLAENLRVSLSIDTTESTEVQKSLVGSNGQTKLTIDEQELIAVRAKMMELFQAIKGFRMGEKIPREELYERGSIH